MESPIRRKSVLSTNQVPAFTIKLAKWPGFKWVVSRLGIRGIRRPSHNSSLPRWNLTSGANWVAIERMLSFSLLFSFNFSPSNFSSAPIPPCDHGPTDESTPHSHPHRHIGLWDCTGPKIFVIYYEWQDPNFTKGCMGGNKASVAT